MKQRGLIFLVIFLAILLAGCLQNRQPRLPDKIPHLSGLSSLPIGSRTEFAVWVGGVGGDESLGIELNASDTANNYPRAFVSLKDGQPDPGNNHFSCVRATLSRREEINDSLIYYFKDGELIDCY